MAQSCKYDQAIHSKRIYFYLAFAISGTAPTSHSPASSFGSAPGVFVRQAGCAGTRPGECGCQDPGVSPQVCAARPSAKTPGEQRVE